MATIKSVYMKIEDGFCLNEDGTHMPYYLPLGKIGRAKCVEACDKNTALYKWQKLTRDCAGFSVEKDGNCITYFAKWLMPGGTEAFFKSKKEDGWAQDVKEGLPKCEIKYPTKMMRESRISDADTTLLLDAADAHTLPQGADITQTIELDELDERPLPSANTIPRDRAKYVGELDMDVDMERMED